MQQQKIVTCERGSRICVCLQSAYDRERVSVSVQLKREAGAECC